jgi:hypothetical protein
MMLAIYLSSLIRSVLALHKLIDNKETRMWHEKEAQTSKVGSYPWLTPLHVVSVFSSTLMPWCHICQGAGDSNATGMPLSWCLLVDPCRTRLQQGRTRRRMGRRRRGRRMRSHWQMGRRTSQRQPSQRSSEDVERRVDLTRHGSKKFKHFLFWFHLTLIRDA